MKYKRILLKLSGEALMGENQYGIDAKKLEEYVKEIRRVKDEGIEIAIVIGGGNCSCSSDILSVSSNKIDEGACQIMMIRIRLRASAVMKCHLLIG
jgi:uridylate kinase